MYKSIEMESLCEEICELIQVVPAEITTIALEKQGNIVLNLRILKESLQSCLKEINKTLSPAEAHLCRTIADEIEDGVTYQHPYATITATAKGWFNIENAMVFYNWIQKTELLFYDKTDTQELFVMFCNSKKARAELCEGYLRQGKNLPDGIKEYIVASVTIRRKSNG